jgi:hypothetical protein
MRESPSIAANVTKSIPDVVVLLADVCLRSYKRKGLPLGILLRIKPGATQRSGPAFKKVYTEKTIWLHFETDCLSSSATNGFSFALQLIDIPSAKR